MPYSHTQTGRLMIAVLILTSLLFAGIFVAGREAFNLAIIALMIGILFIIGSFVTLNVTIDAEYLRIKFGYGIFKKKFKLDSIVSAKAEKHKWYHGWGIRYWPWAGIWIYTVSGWDVVEIEIEIGPPGADSSGSKKKYRIGTDEPQELERAILGSC